MQAHTRASLRSHTHRSYSPASTSFIWMASFSFLSVGAASAMLKRVDAAGMAENRCGVAPPRCLVPCMNA
jgi:hypothetical protein